MIDVDIVGQLVPNPLTMFVQLCSTLVLFYLMKAILWESVKDFLNKRSEKMQSDLMDSEKAKQEAFGDRQKALEQLNQASGRAEEIVSAAIKEARDEKDTILAQANREAEAVRQKARYDIEAERREMYEGLRSEMVNVAMDAAGKLIGERDSADLDRQAVDAFVKEVCHDE
ncbi:MAG: F0F1 ATP synthase subunit B [Solobacterium sp.]|nr:F0F1 ATP synthase subunit B [Solobacterium sp.]